MPHRPTEYAITDEFRAGFLSRSNSVETVGAEQDGILTAAIHIVENHIRQTLPAASGLEPDDDTFALVMLPHSVTEAIYEVAVVLEYGRGDITGRVNPMTPIAEALLAPYVACLEVFADEPEAA